MALSAAGSPVKAGRQGLPGPQARRHDPDDEPGQKPADDEDGDQDPPGEEPPPRPGLHGRQDLGVDDGVVDAGDRLEEGKPQDDQDRGGDIHCRLPGVDSEQKAQGKDKEQRAHRQAKRPFIAASKRRAIRRKAK